MTREGLEWLKCRGFARLPWLLHAFSTRRGGVSRAPVAGLNLGYIPADQRANVEQNRRLFFSEIGAQGFWLAGLRQIHSAEAYQVVRRAPGELEYRPAGDPVAEVSAAHHPAGDALLTDRPGILLSVRSADCLPVLLVDARQRALAAVHVGRHGALQRIVERTVGAMRQLFGSEPQWMLAALGPSIRACCYEVGREVVDAFCGAFRNGEKFFRQPTAGDRSPARTAGYPQRFLRRQPPGRAPQAMPAAHLDLVAVALDQLRRASLRPCNIWTAPFCTACRTDLFFSHRREGDRTGRMMAVLGIRPEPNG